jgi:hypothetical protein
MGRVLSDCAESESSSRLPMILATCSAVSKSLEGAKQATAPEPAKNRDSSFL